MNAHFKNDEVWDKLTSVFQKLFDRPDLELKKEMTSWDIPGWDSIMHLQIILMLEKEFAVRFDPPEILSLHEVNDLYQLVVRKVQEKK